MDTTHSAINKSLSHHCIVFRYPCYLKTLVEEWRAMWSVESGTTDPQFPFGVFTLASTEGQCGDGGFRHAQTLNNGVLPSPQLPNTFVAQGFDAQDPVSITNWPEGERACRAFGWNSPYSMVSTNDLHIPNFC